MSGDFNLSRPFFIGQLKFNTEKNKQLKFDPSDCDLTVLDVVLHPAITVGNPNR
jgi:hypothetical protein